MVPLTGLEPVQYRYRGILSPLCLPIPPQRRLLSIIAHQRPAVKSIEGKSKISWKIHLCKGTIHSKTVASGHTNNRLGHS